MLREMGLRLWLPPEAQAPTAAAPDSAAPPASAPTSALTSKPAPALASALASSLVSALVPAAVPAAAPAAARALAPLLAPPPAAPAQPVISPQPGSVTTLDWPALRSAVAACTACSLCQSRQQTVFGTGHLRAHCMIVGDAPDEQEDVQGEPFVGESGQLLDRMLAALGLSRQPGEPARQVFIANALKCRPPRNRNPSLVELAQCQPFLLRQVALVQPRVILAMGRFAVQSLLGSDAPIGKLRGQLHGWQGVPVVVTYHPAYLLRQPQAKADAWDDLCRAAQLLDAAPG